MKKKTTTENRSNNSLVWVVIAGLSLAVLGFGVFAFVCLPSSEYARVAGLVSAIAALLAVIWFTAGLMLQSRQIAEQRQQFMENFHQLREDARRNSIIIAKDILADTEKRALEQNKSLNSISELITVYADFPELATMLKSTDPRAVIEAGKKWLTKEGPAVTIMRGIATAAKVYLDSIDQPTDYSKDPEEFVYIYGPLIWKLPYFQAFQALSTFLSEIMIRLVPGRKSALLAYQIAVALTSPKGLFKTDKILEDVDNLKKVDYPVPEIAKLL